jgi:hypothetical protein
MPKGEYVLIGLGQALPEFLAHFCHDFLELFFGHRIVFSHAQLSIQLAISDASRD